MKSLAFAILGSIGLLFAAPGEENTGLITVVNEVLTPGQHIMIQFDSLDLAGQTDVIEIDDGGSPPQSMLIPIDLDQNGQGYAMWYVPVWDMAVFNEPTAESVTRAIATPN